MKPLIAPDQTVYFILTHESGVYIYLNFVASDLVAWMMLN